MSKLVNNILFRALLDWAAVCRSGDYPVWAGEGQRSLPYWEVEKFEDASAELEVFFRSAWCEELADVGGSYLAYLQQVKAIHDCKGEWYERRAWEWAKLGRYSPSQLALTVV